MKLYKNGDRIEITRFENEHEEMIEIFKVRYENQSQRIVVLKPIPDLILVDFTEEKIFGVEIATYPQLHAKKLKYHKSGFDEFIYVRTKCFEIKEPKIVLK